MLYTSVVHKMSVMKIEWTNLMLAFTGTQQASVLGHERDRSQDTQTSCDPNALQTTVLLLRTREIWETLRHLSMLSQEQKVWRLGSVDSFQAFSQPIKHFIIRQNCSQESPINKSVKQCLFRSNIWIEKKMTWNQMSSIYDKKWVKSLWWVIGCFWLPSCGKDASVLKSECICM